MPFVESSVMSCRRCGGKELFHLLPVFLEDIDISVNGNIRVEVDAHFHVTYFCKGCGNMVNVKTFDHETIENYLYWYESMLE